MRTIPIKDNVYYPFLKIECEGVTGNKYWIFYKKCHPNMGYPQTDTVSNRWFDRVIVIVD